jgi:hypothetical protein
MAFANANISDIVATTIESRTKKIANNVESNNALLGRLKSRGNVKTFSGGYKILQELSFAENSNLGWYSGYDILPVGVADVISSAEFSIKQAAVPVIISGLEQLQNSGPEQMIDLLEGRIKVAEQSMSNLLSAGIYSDGLGAGGKEVDGLEAMIPLLPAATPYGGIDGSAFTFWQNVVQDSADATTLLSDMNSVWSQLVRGADRPDLIPCDSIFWNAYVGVLQANQRFSNTNDGDAGFMSVKFMDADVVLDGGIYNVSSAASTPPGSSGAVGAPAGTAFFLNTDYMFYRPHRDRNMVPLSPNRRYATNQDAEVQILGWAGNMTCSGRQFQGRIDINGP